MKASSEILTEIIPGKLWQGGIEPVEADWRLPPEVVQIATVMDYRPSPAPKFHHIYLDADDGSKLPGEKIHNFCRLVLEMPTYLHCYSGFNRSTAMACCSLILHNMEVPGSILGVLVQRNSELARSRSGACTNMTWQMQDNVRRYVDYLKCKEGLKL